MRTRSEAAVLGHRLMIRRQNIAVLLTLQGGEMRPIIERLRRLHETDVRNLERELTPLGNPLSLSREDDERLREWAKELMTIGPWMRRVRLYCDREGLKLHSNFGDVGLVGDVHDTLHASPCLCEAGYDMIGNFVGGACALLAARIALNVPGGKEKMGSFFQGRTLADEVFGDGRRVNEKGEWDWPHEIHEPWMGPYPLDRIPDPRFQKARLAWIEQERKRLAEDPKQERRRRKMLRERAGNPARARERAQHA
jgi:hypothetical protein